MTGVYWKFLCIKNEDYFTIVSVSFVYGLNLAVCYISIIYFNIIGRSYVTQIQKLVAIHNVMEEIGIPYSAVYLYRCTISVLLALIPILMKISSLTFTLAETMCLVYPYLIRTMFMVAAAQAGVIALQMVSLYVKPLKNLKKHKDNYTLDEQIQIILTSTKLMWMYQNMFRTFNEIYGILFFINIYANSLEMAFAIGYTYIRGGQDKFSLSCLMLYIPGYLINSFLYTSFHEVNTKVSRKNK